MASEVEICNQALARLGQPPIISLADPSRGARLCSLFYAPKRDELLRHYRWKFAIRLVNLPAGAPAPLFGWAYRYPLPTDALRVLSVNDLDPDMDPHIDRTRWDREGSDIVSNEPPMIAVRYIARVEDPQRFDESFASVLSLSLARYMAPSIEDVGSDLAFRLGEEFQISVAQARHISAIEGLPQRRRPSRSGWLYGGRRGGFW